VRRFARVFGIATRPSPQDSSLVAASHSRPLVNAARGVRMQAGSRTMDINESSEVYGRITRVINELKMARESVTVFKVSELTGIDQLVVFYYFYNNGMLKGK
jgi:hypothetical protein